MVPPAHGPTDHQDTAVAMSPTARQCYGGTCPQAEEQGPPLLQLWFSTQLCLEEMQSTWQINPGLSMPN